MLLCVCCCVCLSSVCEGLVAVVLRGAGLGATAVASFTGSCIYGW
jgi:hypothetical protein